MYDFKVCHHRCGTDSDVPSNVRTKVCTTVLVDNIFKKPTPDGSAALKNGTCHWESSVLVDNRQIVFLILQLLSNIFVLQKIVLDDFSTYKVLNQKND